MKASERLRGRSQSYRADEGHLIKQVPCAKTDRDVRDLKDKIRATVIVSAELSILADELEALGL